ncbi:MAG: response regulator transcription factor [Acetatifactor sp.]|nr:response regulator transcription factor [Acetatifactor sp.]
MKYKVGICDDEIITCEKIEGMLRRIFEKNNLKTEISVFYSGKTYTQYLQKGNTFDFSILDIELFEMNGVDIGKYIRDIQKDLRTQIIYISSKTRYAMELFSVQPLDFLIKPLDENMLEGVILRGLQYLGTSQEYYDYQVGQNLKSVSCADILYFHSEGRRVGIFTVKQEDHFYGRLTNVKARLPAYFEQVHKSYLVNMNMIKECRYEELQLMNGSIIPISRPYRNSLRAKILERKMRTGGSHDL